MMIKCRLGCKVNSNPGGMQPVLVFYLFRFSIVCFSIVCFSLEFFHFEKLRFLFELSQCFRFFQGGFEDGLLSYHAGIVALPLSMALAIAIGVPPQHGLYTAIIAGALILLYQWYWVDLLATLAISRQRPDSSKATKLWHAPALGFLPVQVSRTKDGAETSRLTIERLSR